MNLMTEEMPAAVEQDLRWIGHTITVTAESNSAGMKKRTKKLKTMIHAGMEGLEGE